MKPQIDECLDECLTALNHTLDLHGIPALPRSHDIIARLGWYVARHEKASAAKRRPGRPVALTNLFCDEGFAQLRGGLVAEFIGVRARDNAFYVRIITYRNGGVEIGGTAFVPARNLKALTTYQPAVAGMLKHIKSQLTYFVDAGLQPSKDELYEKIKDELL